MGTEAYPFIDQASGREMAVYFGDHAGVEHPDCDYLAEVMPDLDAFFCRYCQWNGRISGAWFMGLLEAHPDGSSDATP
jgi:hypothetical protein